MSTSRSAALRHTLFCTGFLLSTAACLPSLAANDTIPTALQDYVLRAEDVYQWKLLSKQSTPLGTVYDLDLTSQRWQGIIWQHALQVYEPSAVEYSDHMLLFITGGTNGKHPAPGEMAMGLQLAKTARARVAMLFQVPNQPLLDGRKEDDLITETWLRYLETGDETWPLLFPMVKSAVKAMDAVEALAAAEWHTKVKGFVITGGSKRGWTSWLTPVADRRVVATAPMVIDVLNFKPQMQHQLDSWGHYSEQIRDYSSKGLIKINGETPREAQLRVMMDPYTYRQRLEVPKLIVNGTNDRYWTVDATQFYWPDLVGPKYLLKLPNAGHGLDAGRETALRTVCAFFQHVARKSAWPEIRWTEQDTGREVELQMTSTARPREARLWRAESANKDFREARWSDQPMTLSNNVTAVTKILKPANKHIAYFGEMRFDENGLPFSLTTLVFVD